jgi:DNA-directed RNA polymerase II subunit RPB2
VSLLHTVRMADWRWSVVDEYFRAHPRPRAHVAVSGYDQFVTDGLPALIGQMNPFVMTKPASRERVEVYVGGEDGSAYELVPPTVWPNEARLHDTSYSAELVAKITVKHTAGQEAGSYDLEGVAVARVPVMLRSGLCRLSGLSPAELRGVGECPYDEGGYFVAGGKEKVVVSSEIGVTNRANVHVLGTGAVACVGRVRSVTGEGDFPRTLEVAVLRKTNELVVNGRVSQGKLRARAAYTLPLFTFMRMLGVETDDAIVSTIRANGGAALGESVLLEALRPSATVASAHGHTQSAAIAYAARRLSRSQRVLLPVEVHRIVDTDVLPNAHGDKAAYLGAIVADVLRVHHGIDSELDRDATFNKRVETAGAKFGDLFRDYYAAFRREAMDNLDRAWHETRDEGVSMSKLVTRASVSRLLPAHVVTEGMDKGLKGSWGLIAHQEGVVHEVDRLTMQGASSQLSRVTNPLSGGSADRAPRHAHGSHWGVICPLETPESREIGLVKHLAVLARVTPRGVCSATVKGVLLEAGGGGSTGTPVWLNGTPLGRTEDALALVGRLRELRLGGGLHPDVSVSWRPGRPRVDVHSDAGRLTRPLLRCSKGRVVGSKTAVSWDELLSTGAVEYVSVTEADDCMVAMVPDDVDERTTHCELHPSTILSSVAALVPFSNHNPSPRNLFACKQIKACASVYVTSFASRADVSSHLLHYGQRPLVTTRYAGYHRDDELPYGVNAIVAIASTSGDNQEDAIIFNSASLQRGMFHSTHFHTLVYDSKFATADAMHHVICNPVTSRAAVSEEADYSTLDATGLPRVSADIAPGCALLGRVLVTPDTGAEEDASVVADTTVHGTVGRVVTYDTATARRVKIRLHELREPEVGDKFASRHGQKGVIGSVRPPWDLPFLADGSVPDLIINPHAFPSRMTVAHMLEAIGAKGACVRGVIVDATPFTRSDAAGDMAALLADSGCEGTGVEVAHSPLTGAQMGEPLFWAPTYYMRLKHMVVDKVSASRKGKRDRVTRQPGHGRANAGGQRIGEMERDSILANGLASFLRESFVERADAPRSPVTFVEGRPSKRHADHGVTETETRIGAEVLTARVPYALTLAQTELAAMGLGMSLRGEDLLQGEISGMEAGETNGEG